MSTSYDLISFRLIELAGFPYFDFVLARLRDDQLPEVTHAVDVVLVDVAIAVIWVMLPNCQRRSSGADNKKYGLRFYYG